MALSITKTKPTGDNAWGYVFGIDGIWSFEQTQEHLGGMSRSKIERLADAGKIRKGRDGRVYFCRRSVVEHAQSIEQ